MAEQEEVAALPDHLRCNRTDGRQWRCKRRVKDDLKLCEIHYLQGRHRQFKEKVPESLKIQRKSSNGGISSQKKESTLSKVMKKKGSVTVSDRLNETLKKLKVKKGDVKLELIRMVLSREVEKRKKKELENKLNKNKKKETAVVKKNNYKVLMRELPNGVMEISPALPECHSGNVGPTCDVKVGAEMVSVSHRQFRSKNIEPHPIGALQALPYGCNVGRLKKGNKRKKCHWCQRSGSWSSIKCSSCQKEFFCLNCIKERYFETQEEIKMACPVCRGTCNCRDCSMNQPKDSESKDLMGDKNEVEKIVRLHSLICMLLPVVKQLNKDHTIELETEARIKGKKPSEVYIKQARSNKKPICNYCRNVIVDLYRTCLNCSYNLCLSCYRDLCQGSSLGDIINTSIINKKPLTNKRIKTSYRTTLPEGRVCNGITGLCCPDEENKGCGDNFLDLRCLLPLKWTKELEYNAEEIVCSYDFPDSMDTALCCSPCLDKDQKLDGTEQFLEASVRKDSNDNYLYYPRIFDINRENLEHFQRHWGKGHPIVVRDVLESSDLNWHPVLLFYNYLERVVATLDNSKDRHEDSNCLDWCEVEIGIRQCFTGSLVGASTPTSTCKETLKLKGWLSSHLFRDHFPAHCDEIFRTLPIQKYLNPILGLLNLEAKCPPEIAKPHVGPSVYISYNSLEETVSLARLCYYSYDVVSILAHSRDDPVSTGQLTKVIKLLQRQKSQRESSQMNSDQARTNVSSKEEISQCSIIGGEEEMQFTKRFSRGPENVVDNDLDAKIMNFQKSSDRIETPNKNCIETEMCCCQWDVFRRQDVPKLIEYLRKFSLESTHPILDQSFFLDRSHKMRLKEEYKIEPWTFEQQVGGAVIIPAGCPYQIRSPKSCVHVVLEFVSPENVAESIRLIDEARLLPENYRAKMDKLEVKKMALHTIDAAIKEIHDLTCSMQLA